MIEALVRFPPDSQNGDSREAFSSEVLTLRKFFDLIERVRRAKPPETALEEEHWHALSVLMLKCRHTLSNLRERLASTRDSRDFELHYNEPWKIAQEDRRLSIGPSISTPRAHVNLYTQTLQMSLQAINL